MLFPKLTATALVLLTALSACGDSQTPEERARSKAKRAEIEAVWATRTTTHYQGTPVEVAIAPDRSYALVQLDAFGETISVTQLEGAARAASGCVAKDKSILSMLSGPQDTPIKVSVFSNVRNRLRISLEC